MMTTFYIIVSVATYIFDTYPEHKIWQTWKELERLSAAQKSFYKIEVFAFYAATANIIVCAIIFLLKCIGVLEWW